MITQIINIGNSKGIRIPKKILELANISGEVELSFRNKTLVISPLKKTLRSDWDNLFLTDSKKHKGIEETPLQFIENEFDRDEWVW
ncbi:MAG: AbrB/MazE/SpoVT family DNA-binding domain-containing protein [Bacteroidota bacterium]|jgi:antitoxin MazE